jgi:hypothetical protein
MEKKYPIERPFRVITKTGEVHEVHKYINNDGEESIWCDEWYGRHVIGQDCEWQQAPAGAVWVKASERLPGIRTQAKWRLDGEEWEAKETVLGMWYNRPDTFNKHEWLDEGNADEFKQK